MSAPAMPALSATGLSVRLAGKRIVLGVTGGIAAYKAVEICRRLVDAGAYVVPVMTAGAERFLGATTLSAPRTNASGQVGIARPPSSACSP